MKTSLLLILAVCSLMPVTFDSAFASCIADVDYEQVFEESDLVFKGTVIFIDNSPGPQKIHFDVHEVAKGVISEERYVLENTNFVNLGNDSYTSSSVDVEYKVGTTYNVYVMDGYTSLCTTKITSPPRAYNLPEVLPLVEQGLDNSSDSNETSQDLPSQQNTIGSYELEEPICLGGPGMKLDENCTRIEEYDPYQEDEEMRMASEKVYEIEESMGGGSGTAVFNEYSLQMPIVIIGIILGVGIFAGLMIFLRKK